jgi:leucyl aminopeptidase (aminopeptidase T)
MKSKIEIGALQAVKAMKISSKDKVAIVTDYRTKPVADAIAKQAEKIAGAKIFYLEDYVKRPAKYLPKEIRKGVKNASAIYYAAVSYKGERDTLRVPLINMIKGHKREAHMPDITLQIFKEGMNADYSRISRFAKKLYSIVRPASEIRVITKAGSDFTAEFSNKIKWLVYDGDISRLESKWGNLPEGEVFTCVKNCNGNIVVDGVLGDYFDEKYGLLKTPVYLQVKNDRIISLKCKNKELEHELIKYSKQDKNANRIGEFSFGINYYIKHLIGNMLQDEKFPGIHISIGHGYPSETNSGWNSKAHCDCVLKHCTVFVDGKKIMQDSKYLIH